MTHVQAGFARVDITPDVGASMSGYAARTGPATGVHDPLEIRGIAVGGHDDPAPTSILLVADLVALDIETVTEMAGRVGAAVGLPAGQISISVTHTHGGPAVTGDRLCGQADPAYMRRLADAAVECATEAVRAQVPVSIHIGRSEVGGAGHNRRAGETVVDPAVHAVALRRLDGDLLAVLFSYACHAVALGPDNRLITADWPGFARTHLERALNVPTVFAQGCAGQINTGHAALDSMVPGHSAGRTFEAAEQVGALVADAAARAVRSALDARAPGHSVVRVASETVALPFQDDVAEPLTASVTLHQWGGARLLCLPGEPFVELALDTRTAAGDPDLLVLGYAGGVPGYVPYPPALYANGGYEICEAHLYYGQPAAFAAEAALALRAAAERLLGAGTAAG